MKLEIFLSDGIVMGSNTKEQITMMEDAIGNIKKYQLWNSPIIWRGFRKKRIADKIVLITNDREGYRDKSHSDVDKVLDGLNLKYVPVFATRIYNNARFFGEPHILVPTNNFSVFINDNVDDILVVTRDKEDTIENLIKGYVEYKNEIPPTKLNREIIFSCKSYYLISHIQLLGQHTQKSKYATIKKREDLNKYNDVVKLYNEYVSYWKWWYKQRGREFTEE